MSKASTAKTSSDAHDDAPLRRADITAGKRVLRQRGHGAAVRPNKQRVNVFLDGAAIGHFKSKTGCRGCQTIINEAPKQAISGQEPGGRCSQDDPRGISPQLCSDRASVVFKKKAARRRPL